MSDVQPPSVLVKDPSLPWDGPFPYEYLSTRLVECGGAPIDPAATADRVRELLYDLMAARRTDDESRMARAAWDELRQPRRRLVHDFFMYELPAAVPDVVLAAIKDVPVPVQLPDFRDLAAVEIRFDISVPVPAVPSPVPPLHADVGTAPAVDLGDLRGDLLALWENVDD